MGDICHRMESARDVIMREWRARRVVQLDTSGNWHRCTRDHCKIDQLAARVCLEGSHVIESLVCPVHPVGEVVHVTDLYVCCKIGTMHVCDRVNCISTDGTCSISGLPCAAVERPPASERVASKRPRRKQNGVHTNEQSACILLYDLLFSARRVRYEVKRLEGMLDMARRHTQRLVRAAMRTQTTISYQSLVDVHVSCRQRLRSVRHLTADISPDVKKAICRHHAVILTRVWDAIVAKLPGRCTFEGVSAAILYGMRRGVACDGLLAIPQDMCMACALPDAHAITDVGISRRSLTQSKNALFDAIQYYIHSGNTSVEQFRAMFQPCEHTF